MKPGLIFRGTGKRTIQEQKEYDSNVDVFWQENAWADREVCDKWATTTFIPNIGIINYM
jgi:hypothetical protein